MGGTFDSTNVIDHPAGVIITPVDIDHQAYLGTAVADIAVSKAGILKRGSPAVFGRQRDEGLAVLEARAKELGVTPFVFGRDFDGYRQSGRLVYQDQDGLIDLPPPALVGFHQFENAALAIASARHFGLPVGEAEIAEGLRKVEWPARLAPVKGRLRDMLPAGHELWLDGGHNAHGAAALARALAEMQAARPAPLVMILGMMNTRSPADFLAPFAGKIRRLLTLDIPGEQNAHSAELIAEAGRAAGIDTEAKPALIEAIEDAAKVDGARVVICGSLYLAGHVLAENGTPPE
jgi:dihydrofolate synthase/folylpolyglutamate synthase